MLARMRIAFLGNDPWSVPSLQALARSRGIDVAIVATRVPRPAGRGSKLTPTKVADAARTLGLPLLEAETVRTGEGLEALRDSKPDVLVVVAYGEILTRDVLGIATPVNLHFSILPRWRGAAPVQHAILAGDESTGITVMMMDEGLDTGPILDQRREPIHPDDDAGSLGARLAAKGAELLVATLPRLGEIEPRRQAEDAVTLAPKLTLAERSIDWSEPAEAIVRRVRAFAPSPAATTRIRAEAVKILRAQAAAGGSDAERTPGTVASVDALGFTVAAGDGLVRPLEVGPAGRTHMSAAEYVRGLRLQPGERLG
jgi:methionyl-tRNA formyltransferase